MLFHGMQSLLSAAILAVVLLLACLPDAALIGYQGIGLHRSAIFASAARVSATHENLTDPQAAGSLFKNKAAALNGIGEVALTGGYWTCFHIDLTIQGTILSVSVDAGSTDLAVGTIGLSNYDASAGGLVSAPPANAPQASGAYGDGSWWSGYGTQTTIGVTGTSILANNAPLAVITDQSADPIFVKGAGSPNQQGLLGIGYPMLSQFSFVPETVVDAWHASGTLRKNEVAFHACPYNQIQDSYIDFGNDDPTYECNPSGVPIAWAKCPVKSYFTLDIRNISVSGKQVTLPSQFQTIEPRLYGGNVKAWSIIDSCSSLLRIPTVVNNALKAAVKSSGAMPTAMTSTQVDSFLAATTSYTISTLLKWNKLPNITFDIVSDEMVNGTSRVFSIVLGGRQYIQCDNDGYCAYLVTGGTETYATLGIPVFSNLHIVFDRTNARVGFAPGCGCTTATDGYPKIQWKASTTTAATTTMALTPTTVMASSMSTVWRSTSTVATTTVALPSTSSTAPSTTTIQPTSTATAAFRPSTTTTLIVTQTTARVTESTSTTVASSVASTSQTTSTNAASSIAPTAIVTSASTFASTITSASISISTSAVTSTFASAVTTSAAKLTASSSTSTTLVLLASSVSRTSSSPTTASALSTLQSSVSVATSSDATTTGRASTVAQSSMAGTHTSATTRHAAATETSTSTAMPGSTSTSVNATWTSQNETKNGGGTVSHSGRSAPRNLILTVALSLFVAAILLV
ncbi:aspartic peptidase domain-containing protein [Entophlyctis helioformis]|nr:aspartic peptidase domain-containing protein [Entophlyctis helioformis]